MTTKAPRALQDARGGGGTTDERVKRPRALESKWRNSSDEQKSYLRGRRYREEKKQGERTDLTSGHDVHKSTSEMLAEEYGTSEKTIRRDALFSHDVDTIAANVGAGAVKRSRLDPGVA
jgi:hypothetical protein